MNSANYVLQAVLADFSTNPANIEYHYFTAAQKNTTA